MKRVAEKLVGMIADGLGTVDERDLARFDAMTALAQKIFIFGAGRSGLIGKFFGMRLMHTGKTVHIVGETCTPKIDEDSLLILISGSGETCSAVTICGKARAAGARIVLFTSKTQSRLGLLADLVITVPTPAQKNYEEVNIAPMGTVFETTTLIMLESFLGYKIVEEGIAERELRYRHTNLE